MFSPRDLSAGFEAWPGLDELFPTSFQGVNPNRGLEGSVADTDRDALAARMSRHFSASGFEALQQAFPTLMTKRAGYDPKAVWTQLRGR